MEPYYDEDGITIYHGDCREVTAWLDADVLVTDPPYGISHRSGRKGMHGDASIVGDESVDARDAVLAAWGARPALVFGKWSRARPIGTRAVLTWDKGGQFGMGDLALPWKPNTEEVYVLGSGFHGSRTTSVLRYPPPCISANHPTHHPTEKSLPLMRDLLSKCPPGVIADPFMGSGTTLRAAKDLGRKAVGVEADEAYCEIAAKRLQQGVLTFGEAS